VSRDGVLHDFVRPEAGPPTVVTPHFSLSPSTIALIVVWAGIVVAPCTSRATAAQVQTVFDGAPAASWIAPPGIPGDSFVVFHARRTFDLSARPAQFIVHVSADNRYRLFVNGVSVASGPQRSDVAHWKYETVDLAPRLHAGPNVIAAVVWSWGAARPVAQHSHRTGLLVQGQSAREAALVNTGPGWRLLVDSAYAPIRHHERIRRWVLRRGARRGGRRTPLPVGLGSRAL
jgi:hypothetical protein